MATNPHNIIQVLHEFIADERKRSFSFLANHSHEHMEQEDLLKVNIADAFDVEDTYAKPNLLHAPQADTQWYVFTEVYQPYRMDRTVAISCPQAGSEVRIEDLNILDPFTKQGSFKAADWIRAKYDWSENLEWEMKDKEHQHREQQMWWDSNGQHFKLLDLPAELRETVYLHILGPVVVPRLHKRCLVLGHGQRYEAEDEGKAPALDPDVEPPNMRIMRLCKQVHREASVVAARDTTKRLRVTNTRKTSIDGILFRAWKTWPNSIFLRNMQLEMSAAQYFRCIGINPVHGDPWKRSRDEWQLSTLKDFPALKTLDFRFISPKNQRAECPWPPYGPPRVAPVGSMASMFFQGNLPPQRLSREEARKRHSCQKIWIDWFFLFAWDTLSSLRDVKFTLSGCVKNSTRAHWQQRLNDKRIDHTADMHARRQAIIEEKTNDDPIPCKCSTRCPPSGPALFQFSEHEIRRIEGLREEIEKAYWDFEN